MVISVENEGEVSFATKKAAEQYKLFRRLSVLVLVVRVVFVVSHYLPVPPVSAPVPARAKTMAKGKLKDIPRQLQLSRASCRAEG